MEKQSGVDPGSLDVERRFSFPPCNRFYIQMKTLFWLTRHRNGDYYAHIMYRWKAYNYRDIEQTFLLLGHTVDNIEQHLGNYDIDPEFEKIIEHKIQETHYDMVFTVNYFALISNVCQKMGIKYVSWSCDNPLISMYHESIFHPCNYIFTFDKTNYLEFREMGVEHIWYLPLAVDTNRMDMVIANSPEIQKYKGDIAFVGSFMKEILMIR